MTFSHSLAFVALLLANTCTLLRIAAAAPTQGASFTPIPVTVGQFVLSGTAEAISADGLVVVGNCSFAISRYPWRWTAAGGTEILGGTQIQASAQSVSADGSVVAGTLVGTSSSIGGAYRWTAQDGFVPLKDAIGNRVPSSGVGGMSDDGLTIVGSTSVASDTTAFRWTASTGIVSLPMLTGVPSSASSTADGVSRDGSIIVGATEFSSSTLRKAVVWAGDQPPQLVPVPSSTSNASAANDVSADGLVIVGSAEGAFRTTPSGTLRLPDGQGFPVRYQPFRANATSADGSIVVGEAEVHTPSLGLDTFIWDPDNGTRSLKALLIELGVDMGGWNLVEATGISDDGRTIVGYGLNTALPGFQPWVATIPEPGLLPVTLFSALTLTRRRTQCHDWWVSSK